MVVLAGVGVARLETLDDLLLGLRLLPTTERHALGGHEEAGEREGFYTHGLINYQ